VERFNFRSSTVAVLMAFASSAWQATGLVVHSLQRETRSLFPRVHLAPCWRFTWAI